MASNPNNPKKKNQRQDPDTNPQAQGRQSQPGEQDRQNVNKASDAQLNQGGAGQGQHGSARGTRTERDENMEPSETGSRQPGRSSN